jgi:aldo/keto reductase family protein
MRIREALLAGPLGFGTPPLGNMYRDIPEDEAIATVDAAWDAGARFFDTAPFYGAGLAGSALARHSPSDLATITFLAQRSAGLSSTRSRTLADGITAKRTISSSMAAPTRSSPIIRPMAP